MKQAMKIKGILAMCDVTYGEFAEIANTSRQTLHRYLNDPHVSLDDTEVGKGIIKMSKVLEQLFSEGKLPLTKPLTKDEKMVGLKELTNA
jgi:predicted DNA-binding protein YlxM (UPF0122 family)